VKGTKYPHVLTDVANMWEYNTINSFHEGYLNCRDKDEIFWHTVGVSKTSGGSWSEMTLYGKKKQYKK
jgi:hypothetical protein